MKILFWVTLTLLWAISGCDDSSSDLNSQNTNNSNNTSTTNNTNSTNNTNNTSTTADHHAAARYGAALDNGVVSHEEITEASGIAFSRVNPGVIWLHNDSGDGPYVYAIDTAGNYLGELHLSGVWAEDWEDMAVGLFQGSSAIFVGDFGDNAESRETYAIHIIPEPSLDGTAPFGTMEITDFTTWEFDYGADGPRNCEAMMVDPAGTVFLVEKALGTSASLWRLSQSAPTSAVYVGEVALGQSELITGADLCEHGRAVVLSTYGRILHFVLSEGEGVEALVDAEINQALSINLYQLEALALEPGPENIWFLSEGANQHLYSFPILK